jgi:hypothetical protein
MIDMASRMFPDACQLPMAVNRSGMNRSRRYVLHGKRKLAKSRMEACKKTVVGEGEDPHILGILARVAVTCS